MPRTLSIVITLPINYIYVRKVVMLLDFWSWISMKATVLVSLNLMHACMHACPIVLFTFLATSTWRLAKRFLFFSLPLFFLIFLRFLNWVAEARAVRGEFIIHIYWLFSVDSKTKSKRKFGSISFLERKSSCFSFKFWKKKKRYAPLKNYYDYVSYSAQWLEKFLLGGICIFKVAFIY